MIKQSINIDIMEYMVWVVELVADRFFDGNKTATFNVLKETGIWDAYIQNYDITHSLGANTIINEIHDILTIKEVI